MPTPKHHRLLGLRTGKVSLDAESYPNFKFSVLEAQLGNVLLNGRYLVWIYTTLHKAQLFFVIKVIRRNNYSTVRGNYLLVSTINIFFPKVWVLPTAEKVLTLVKLLLVLILKFLVKHPLMHRPIEKTVIQSKPDGGMSTALITKNIKLWLCLGS